MEILIILGFVQTILHFKKTKNDAHLICVHVFSDEDFVDECEETLLFTRVTHTAVSKMWKTFISTSEKKKHH